MGYKDATLYGMCVFVFVFILWLKLLQPFRIHSEWMRFLCLDFVGKKSVYIKLHDFLLFMSST